MYKGKIQWSTKSEVKHTQESRLSEDENSPQEHHWCNIKAPLYYHSLCTIVWLESLTGRYFGRLLKICHLAEFTLAVEPVLDIMMFRTNWLIEHTGNLPGPRVSFGSDRMKLVTKCNWKLDISFGSLTLLPPPVYKTLWRSDVLVRSF